MAKHYQVVTLFEPNFTSDGVRRSGDGEFFTNEQEANAVAVSKWGGHASRAEHHKALRVPGGWYYLLSNVDPVTVHGTWQHKAKLQEERRKSALAKLTPEEIEALGIKIAPPVSSK